MRRLRRRGDKRGLVEDRRRLVRRYLDGDEPQQASAEPPPSTGASTPELDPSGAVAPEAPSPATAPEPRAAAEIEPRRPLPPEPLGPAAFDDATRMLEEIVRLCEQVRSLGQMRARAEGRLDRRVSPRR